MFWLSVARLFCVALMADVFAMVVCALTAVSGDPMERNKRREKAFGLGVIVCLVLLPVFAVGFMVSSLFLR